MATETTKLTFVEGAAASTPASGRGVVYFKADGLAYSKDDAGAETLMSGGAGGAPSTVNYLVGTADGGLSAEIVVGTSPGGELGGTWASPTVDATHSGSAHLIAPVGNRVLYTGGNYAVSTTSFADLDATNLSITLTTLARRVLIGCTASCDASNTIELDIDIDGARQGQTHGLQALVPGAASATGNLSFTYMTAALTAASHIFKVMARVTAGSGTIYASTTVTPFTFWVAEQLF